MSYLILAPEAIAAEAARLTPEDFEGVDGVLLDAVFTEYESVSLGRTAQFAWGYIYGDKKHRFHQGEYIRTTAFVEAPVDGVYKTRNSTYRIRPRPEAADDADA